MYFTDLKTGLRLKDYTDVAIPAAAGTQTQNATEFIAEEYSYQTAAADGSGTYQYTGMKYTITQADGKKIILLSRGLGRGTDTSCFEVFMQNNTTGTLAVRCGSVLYGSDGTAVETAAIDHPSTGVMGLLRTGDVYWFDRNGGSDMGGLTYSLHTDVRPASLVEALQPSVMNQVVRFDLMLMSAENALYRYMLVPALLSETFVPKQGDGGGVPASTGVLGESSRDADVIVNGVIYKAGEESSETAGGKTTVTVTVDTDRLEAILDDEGNGALVVIPIEGDCSTAKGVLDGLMIKALTENGATLELRTASAAYSIPASLLELDALKEQNGASAAPENITLELIISEPSAQMASVVDNAARSGSFSLVVPAVDFTAIYTCAGQTKAITDFNAYVTRRIAIPEGVDPNSVTTVVTVDAAGKVRPLPTKLVTINGVTYAQFVSLANSTYAVISHSAAFNDISGHWAQAVISDMGSRLIVSGTGGGRYEPDRNMTRAEFTAIMVYALGIAPKTDASSFPDVKTTDWYCEYIEAAYQYGLVTGCSDGSFGPDVMITREQAMTIMVKAMRLTGLSTNLGAAANDILSAFTDQAGLSSYARQSAAVCVKAGLVYGKNSRILAPQDYITRAEVAAIVQRLLKISDLI
jgi:hypothetical protein